MGGWVRGCVQMPGPWALMDPPDGVGHGSVRGE